MRRTRKSSPRTRWMAYGRRPRDLRPDWAGRGGTILGGEPSSRTVAVDGGTGRTMRRTGTWNTLVTAPSSSRRCAISVVTPDAGSAPGHASRAPPSTTICAPVM